MTVETLPTLTITSTKDWQDWIEAHYQTRGAWLKLAKKQSGFPTVEYGDILDIALCYGWIDGQRNGFDEHFFLQKFTPRRPKSIWSKRNVEKIAELTKAGRMTAPGLLEVERAKQDGRWDAAYDSQKDMAVPADFLEALAKNEKALRFFESLNSSNKFAIVFRLTTAKKPETRQRRFEKILSMMEKGEKFH